MQLIVAFFALYFHWHCLFSRYFFCTMRIMYNKKKKNIYFFIDKIDPSRTQNETEMNNNIENDCLFFANEYRFMSFEFRICRFWWYVSNVHSTQYIHTHHHFHAFQDHHHFFLHVFSYSRTHFESFSVSFSSLVHDIQCTHNAIFSWTYCSRSSFMCLSSKKKKKKQNIVDDAVCAWILSTFATRQNCSAFSWAWRDERKNVHIHTM